MSRFVLNPGPLTSFNSLTYHLGPELDEVRNLYVHGSSPEIILDLRNLIPGRINISALAALLSTCSRLSRFMGRPIETLFSLNSKVQDYLFNVDFFLTAKKLKILTWDDKTVGGFVPSSMNPNTKILYYADIFDSIEVYSPEVILEIKAQLKQRIGPNFSLRCSEIFDGFDPRLEYTMENTALELITNCLIHAKDYAFVGIQAGNSRISISVCDSGIGFRKSLGNSYPTVEAFSALSNTQALIVGSLIQQKEHGLRLAISQVLNYDKYDVNYVNDGWVVISSFDSEIRWQKKNWERALDFYAKHSIEAIEPDVDEILGPEVQRKLSYDEVTNGYWRKYKNRLVGTRITFEIPFINEAS